MTRPRTRKHLAWLAFAAMWLLVAAPVISQLLAASPGVPGIAAHCDEHEGDSPSPPLPHIPTLTKCGYCDLLSDSPAVSSVPWLPPAPLSSPYRIPRPLSEPSFARMHFLAAAPRGPPVDADA